MSNFWTGQYWQWGLSAVMTFTGPECFFQSGVEPVSVYAAEEKAVQSKIAGDNSEEGESTTEVTTEKKEESTTATESQGEPDFFRKGYKQR